MLGIVTNVHAGDENVRAPGVIGRRVAARGFIYPKDTEAPQFFK